VFRARFKNNKNNCNKVTQYAQTTHIFFGMFIFIPDVIDIWAFGYSQS
jgi:hypothetical protein